jgi:flagellar hook protein FlgE
MPNFSIALTGLQADSVALDTIGNNLANLNTTAFKGQTTTFEDLFYQTIGTSGANDTLQVGVGTRVSGTQSNFSQGSLSTTGTDTDVALNGNGFFVVQRGNTQSLTRAGNFEVDTAGHLITTGGENVMGYGVTNGVLNTNGALTALQLPVGTTEAAKATQNITLTTSLDSDSAVGATYAAPVKIYDSLGDSHAASITYTKTSPTTWTYSVSLPAGEATGSNNATGTLTFDTSGNLVSPTTNVSGVQITGLTDGAADLNMNFNLYNASNHPLVTQTAGTSNTAATDQDGYTSGVYQKFAVDGNGVISATFSNGNTAQVGQIAIAVVTNQDGLIRAGANDYTTTQASGQASFGVANSGGRGGIDGESLESSNVDISGEFSNLIVAQRAFEANSKTVTTFDSVTENAINMIR